MNQVRTNNGAVRGLPGKRVGNTVYYGIPFARAPVGALRFMPPQEPDCWEGVCLCDSPSPACIQKKRGGGPPETSEDCLYLNVYTPAQDGTERLPVMVWIYGGAFAGGWASDPEFDGEALAEKGAVVVTVNYRCSLFGFFSTEELERRTGFAGNLGLLDQVAALNWVQKNIAAFGGDPRCVTVFGQSAGGISVRMLLVSPLGRGLFHRAIVESGGGLNEADLVRSKGEFQRLCQRCLELAGWDIDRLLLAGADDALEALEVAAHELLAGRELALFQPFVDGVTLLDVPGNSIARGEAMDVPVICGTVAGDSWMFSRKVRSDVPGDAYFRGFAISPSQSWARNQLTLGLKPIYTYYMDRTQPPREQSYRHGTPPFGASTPHGTEIAYVFGTLAARGQGHTPYDAEISEAMQTYWRNFAAAGNPNGTGLPDWPPYEADVPLTMHIGDRGIRAENIVCNDEEERVIAHTIRHPGMLESLDGMDAPSV